MDYGQLFRRGWEIVWQNKFLFVLGFLAALGAGGGGGGGSSNFNFNIPSGTTGTEVFPSDFIEEVSSFWMEFGGLIIGVACFFFILGIAFWLIRLAAQGGLIESVDRIEAGEKMMLGSAFSAGIARISGLVGLNLLLNLPFIVAGIIFAALGFSIFSAIFQSSGNMSGELAGNFAIISACIGLLACLLVPIWFVVTLVYPFAQRGLMLKQLGVVASIRHGWQVLRENVGDVLLLAVAFVVIGFLFGLVTAAILIPFAFLAAGPIFFDLMQGNPPDIGTTEIITLAIGGICLGLVAAAVNSILTAYRSATVTLAYHHFVQKEA